MLRLAFLSNWFVQGSSGYSEFEEQILQMITIHHDIIQTYDPDMDLLEEMHSSLVCLYHYAISLHSRRNDKGLDHWDQEVWHLAFPDGIPHATLEGCGNKIDSLEDWDIYLDCAGKGGFLSTFHSALEDWKFRNINPKNAQPQNTAIAEQADVREPQRLTY